MTYRQRQSRRRKRHGARSFLLLSVGVIATVAVIAVLSVAGYVLAIASTAPDLSEIVRAGIKNLESGETVQGGSTLTQQLVRALYIKDPKRNFARKIREAKLASELEEEHSKTWILDQYLNSVPYGTVEGRTAIGAEAAAVTFFDKHAKNLDLDESALLAGLTQAPSQYNPFRNPQAAIERRNEVLEKMLDNGYISRFEYERAASA